MKFLRGPVNRTSRRTILVPPTSVVYVIPDEKCNRLSMNIDYRLRFAGLRVPDGTLNDCHPAKSR